MEWPTSTMSPSTCASTSAAIESAASATVTVVMSAGLLARPGRSTANEGDDNAARVSAHTAAL